jgi:ribose transport system permease protein
MSELSAQEKKISMYDAIKGFIEKPSFRELLPLIGLVVIIAVITYLTDMRLLRTDTIDLILSQVYVLMIACTGVFLVMTIGGLDFSQGSILGISSIIISYVSFINLPLALFAGIVAGALVGAVNGFFHIKFRMPSFIVTICTMYLFRGLCAYITTDAPVAAVAGIMTFNDTIFKVSLTIAVLLIVYLVFRFTKLGTCLKAIGAGETAAYYSGINVKLTKFLVFTIAGAITGYAAFLNVVKVGSITATAGSQLETQILIALVLGGMPISGGTRVRFSNIVIGTLIYCILNNGLVMLGYDSSVQQLIKGVIFVAVVALTLDRKALKTIK